MNKAVKSESTNDVRVIKDKSLVQKLNLKSDKVNFVKEVEANGGLEVIVEADGNEFIIGINELEPKSPKS